MAERELTGVVKPLAKGQITIPVEFRRRLNIGTDTFLQLTLKGEKIEIVPLRLVPKGEPLLREYTDEEIQLFLEEDKLDPETLAKVRFLLE
ncbi:MAG: AbrB/MazE/SpoVT family DNA-binding domain-containing protein [Anaerolineae bacterium]|nr:AbrB/MazE/SpoVT family DNA-binding domain-containing protein [Anaerolineae bacterium]